MKIDLHFKPCKLCDCQFSAKCKGHRCHRLCPSCIEEIFKPVDKPHYKFHLLYGIGHHVKKSFWMLVGGVGIYMLSRRK